MLPSPLYLSAIAVKMAGYMFEQNVRIAQVLNKATLEQNPFFTLPLSVHSKNIAALFWEHPVVVRPAPRKSQKTARQQLSATPGGKPSKDPLMGMASPKGTGQAIEENEKTTKVAPPPSKLSVVQSAQSQPAPKPNGKRQSLTAEAKVEPIHAKAAKAASKRPRQPSPPPQMPSRTTREAAKPKA